GGKVGGAYEFDGGNDYVYSSYDAIFNPQNFTISLWFNANSWTTETFPGLITRRDGYSTMDWELFYNTDYSHLRFALGESYGDDVFGSLNVNPSTEEWHHLAITKKGTLYELFLDGNSEGTDTSSQTWTDSEGITIGSLETSNNNFDGRIDEVRIYNFSLTSDQIRNIFEQENRSISPNTIIFNETSSAEEWLCEVTPNDGYADGLTKNSSSVTIGTGSNSPVINNVQCAINTTTNWQNCAATLWNDTITQVRVNCTDSDADVSYVTFNLTNVPDSATKFISINATTVSGDWWIYDNSDYKISDSGQFNLTTVCFDESSNSDSNLTTWSIAWGYLNASWITPTSSTNISQYAFSTFTSTVTCLQGECGYINVTIDPATWWNRSWKYRRKLIFDNSQQDENLINFTVLVVLNTTNFNYSFVKSDGSDLRFIDHDNVTILNWHNESWDTSGESLIWIKVPQIDAGSNSDFIWLYYNNSDAVGNKNETGSYDNTFVMVQHLHETSGTHYDSTQYDNDGTPEDSPNQNAVGRIDGGDEFDGTDYVSFGDSPSLNLTTQLTLEVWAKTSTDGYFITRTDSGHTVRQYNWYNYPTDASRMRLYYPPGTATSVAWDGEALEDNQWHYLVITVSSTTAELFNDGDSKGTRTLSSEIAAQTGETWIAARPDGAGGDAANFEGILDEVRISNVARSGDWINASFLSMTNGFLTIESDEELSGKGGTIPVAYDNEYPFWTSSSNPQTCSDMKLGNICQSTWQVNATGTVGDVYEFFVMYESLNYSSNVNRNDTPTVNIEIKENTAPSVTALSFYPTIVNTSSNIQCNATITDSEQSTVTVEYFWYNNSVLW
ncbi:MAG: DUF2341 domain-containing protein, partial [Nanoarchaeota archaeon]|nr:DUF2341 domain-containing protein [Nanoarchaeota archaeon]